MTDMTLRLARLGDDLERAARRDLRPARRRRSRGVAIAAVAAVIAVPGAAVAAIELISEDDVARSMPAGTLVLVGTEPDCTVVRQDVEYHCVLARPPAPEVAPEPKPGETPVVPWNPAGTPLAKGTVEPTVDANSRVNGGCRALNDEATEWQCYVGEEAVRQEIIGPGFLGERVSGPGVG
jgi:hypothetical protein